MLRLPLLLFLLLAGTVAHAETAVVEVYYLPLAEAESAVRTQLSPAGSVTSMPSRRLLIIQDDAAHIEQATALLKRLDARPVQYRATVTISQGEQRSSLAAGVQAVLPGGWVRLTASAAADSMSDNRSYNLRLQSGQPANIEAGEIVPLTTEVQSWLAGYGIVETVTLVPVTGGFDVLVQPAGGNMVRVQLRPWLRRLQPGMHGEGGNIAVAAADTELTIPLGSEVAIAATSADARMLGVALGAARASSGSSQLLMRLKVEQLP